MSAASCATVLYLWKHIKSMKDGSSTISSPHLKKQMRVTITGIAQAVLYFLCAIWTSLDALFRIKLPIVFDMDRHILCTVICFYSFGTTINVCVGQTMLRQRVETMLFIMRTSVTSHLWLNVFYYCQIVPAQRSFLIWLKDNIRVFVYFALIMDRLFFLSSFITSILYYSEIQIISNSTTYTNTSLMDTEQNATAAILRELSETCIIQYWLRFAYFFISLCVMLAASCATVLYLRRHMKRMEESSKSFSSPRLQKQMRVTITGISGVSSPRLQRQIKVIITSILIQATLNFLCSFGVLIDEILSEYTGVDSDGLILFTIISLYSFGTTINMGITQSLFRQGAVNPKTWK
uniref:Taste receptor type 2 n=1 Tax=Astyanax mexicanus TaxID=7994 RepID=A0A8B9RNY4_ASTMX